LQGRTTFCFCVEAGRFESAGVLLARSIRAFAGAYAKLPIFAVRPRPGPELSRAAREAFDALEVGYLVGDLVGAYHWLPHLNKSAALALVETRAQTPYVTWLDTDVVVLAEPAGLVPETPFAYAARPAEADMGTDGDDANAAYWARASALAGLDYRRFEMIRSYPEEKLIHGYWHGGVFTYDRATGCGARHFDYFKRIVDARISSRRCGTYHTDQVAQTLAAHAVTDKVHIYDWRLSYDFPLEDLAPKKLAMLGECAILHYHGGLAPQNRERIDAVLASAAIGPDQTALIAAHAPLRTEIALGQRVLRKAMYEYRAHLRARYERACEVL
jgi:hypothetical protein